MILRLDKTQALIANKFIKVIHLFFKYSFNSISFTQLDFFLTNFIFLPKKGIIHIFHLNIYFYSVHR